MRRPRLLLALLLFGLCLGAKAQGNWEKLAEGDGYRSSLGVIQAQSEPQPVSAVLNTAQAFGGIPYQWAGTNPETGFDCSGYIYEVLRLNGYEVPRMADQQFEQTQRVAYDDLLPGDLVFFTTYLPGPSHAGFYLGDGYFIHASSAGEAVVVSQMETGYYRERFLGGGRPAGWLPPGQPELNLASSEEPEAEQETSPLVIVEPSVAYFKPDISRVRTRYLTIDDSAPKLETRSDEATLKLELLFGEMMAAGQLQVTEFRNSFSRVFGGAFHSLRRMDE